MPKKKTLNSKEGKALLRKARKLEEHKLLSDEELLKVYKEGMSYSEMLKKMLKPAWFVKDLDGSRRKK